MKTVKYKNQVIRVVKVRMEWENKSYWVCLINDQGGDDLFRTQAGAINAGKYIIDNN